MLKLARQLKGQIMSILNKEEKSNPNSNLKEELIKKTEIKDTPFTIIETNGQTFVALGNYKLTNDKRTKEQLIKDFSTPNWNTIITVIAIINEKLKEN